MSDFVDYSSVDVFESRRGVKDYITKWQEEKRCECGRLDGRVDEVLRVSLVAPFSVVVICASFVALLTKKLNGGFLLIYAFVTTTLINSHVRIYYIDYV